MKTSISQIKSLKPKFIFQEDQDWGIVAMVLDRMFLWVFGAAAVVGSAMILTESPSLFDPIQPIDSLITTIGVDTPPPQASS